MNNEVAELAELLFKTDWPRDDWSRFGETDTARLRYVRMAEAALQYRKAKDK